MKRILRLLFPLLCLVPALAQVPVTPIVQPHMTFLNNSGLACAGCSLSTYAAGTTTPQPTFADSTGTSQNTNPIVLGADGGANIWLGSSAYKLVLKDTLGNIIFSVDNVNDSNITVCGNSGAIQAASSSGTNLTCDPTITINTASHTINVGTLTPSHVTIGALGTPTSWTFDTSTPATALASIGGVTLFPAVGIGNSTGSAWGTSYSATNQIPATFISTLNQNTTGTAANLSGTPALPNGTTATTQTAGDNTTKLATDAFVQAAISAGGGGTCTGLGSLPWSCSLTIGTLRFEFGAVNVPSNGTSFNTSSATFPVAFTHTPSAGVNTVGIASSSGDATTPPAVELQSSSTTGLTAFMARVIIASAGGGNFDNAITMNWWAFGN